MGTPSKGLQFESGKQMKKDGPVLEWRTLSTGKRGASSEADLAMPCSHDDAVHGAVRCNALINTTGGGSLLSHCLQQYFELWGFEKHRHPPLLEQNLLNCWFLSSRHEDDQVLW
eukprot:CAMPEP_0171598328 /NCGR_PEP_ID=MMETSP0990-20121206/3062_1 /TAXON_ID=483369 /ORGANISM="non described non described, Strain CCMP2098" /LENGTH=113 /DNA_ID=CAMNT_0012159873 /DNA_START=550 /DNA_END=888 /DNA_ORIENTATION=+